MAAEMEYLAAEILKLTENAVRDSMTLASSPGTSSSHQVNLTLRSWTVDFDYFLSLFLSRNDKELNKLLSGTTITQGVLLPNAQAVLFKKSAGAGGMGGDLSMLRRFTC